MEEIIVDVAVQASLEDAPFAISSKTSTFEVTPGTNSQVQTSDPGTDTLINWVIV